MFSSQVFPFLAVKTESFNQKLFFVFIPSREWSSDNGDKSGKTGMKMEEKNNENLPIKRKIILVEIKFLSD